MTSPIQRTLLSLAVLCTVSLPTTLWAESDAAVTASVTFNDGSILPYELPQGSDLEIETCIGDLTFSCDRIASIDTPAGTDLSTVTLVSGERWRAVINGNPLRAIGLRKTEADIELHGEALRIRFSASETEYCSPAHYMKLLLEDGSQALIDTASLLLPVETEHGKFDLPVAALRALKFLASSEEDDPDIALVRFPTGHVERLRVGSRFSYLRTRDCHGNKLKIYHRDIMGILNPVELSGAATTAQQDMPGTNHVTTRDGQAQNILLPFAVWVLRTDLGKLSLPSPLVRTIRRLPDNPSEVELRTVFGEILTGELGTRKLRILSENDEGYSDIDFDDVVELTTSSPLLPIPAEWLAFYLKPGMAVAGRFAMPSSDLTTDADQAVLSSEIFSLTRAVDDAFTIATEDGTVLTCHPETHKAAIVLLSNGATLTMPWSKMLFAGNQRKIDAAALRMAMINLEEDAGEEEPTENETVKEDTSGDADEGRIQHESKPENERLRLATAIGTLQLLPSDVAAISVDRDVSQACITTVYGDTLLVTVPDRKWFGGLLGTDDYEFPEEKQFAVTLQDIQHATIGKNSVRCRLLSGDILHGTFTEQVVSVRQKDDRRKTTTLTSQELQKVSRGQDGDLSFVLQTGSTVTGDPKERALSIEISATGAMKEVPLKNIEALVVGSKDLPPTTVFLPGLPASLTGEILIQGGSFTRGSDSGMDDERPVHEVSLAAFFMDPTEVTRAQFAAFVRDTGYSSAAEQTGSTVTWRSPGFIQRDDDPVVCVSWRDAATYCNWRSKQAGLDPCYVFEKDQMVGTNRDASGYRLPTEAEWEFAARNRGDARQYPWSAASGKRSIAAANYRQRDSGVSDGWEWTCPVKEFAANELRIYGLGGNVWEWCEDWYFDQAYAALRNLAPHNPCITLNSAVGLTRRVMRGGSFRNDLDLLRCASRGNGLPYAFSNHVGFRCVRNAE